MKSLIAAFVMLMSLSAHAQIDWGKFEKEIIAFVQQPKFVEKVLDNYGVAGVTRIVFREHLNEIYKNETVISYIVEEMRMMGIDKIDAKNTFEFGKKFGSELFLSLAMKGMARLSPDEQRVFLNFMFRWMSVASIEDCKWMMTEGATSSAIDSGKIEIKYYTRLSKEELRAYLRFLRKSIVAEINDFPLPKTLNQNQIKIADTAFENELDRLIKIGQVRIEVLQAMNDMNNSSAKDVCDAGKFIFSIVVNMRGFAGDLMVTKMILSMQ